MSEFQLTTPVAFIIFNRPDTTAKVFTEIAKAKPPKLLVVGDGPRIDRAGEAERVAQTRAIIERVDWPCDLLTNFSDVNLGCKKRVSSGIDWVFDQVEEAIILEDDCLPDPSFFRYCQELLVRYRHDQRIGMISGNNFQFGRRYGNDSYYFSKYFHIWGWASWRNRWSDSYDVSLQHWPKIRDEGALIDMVRDADDVSEWLDIFEKTYQGKIDTWDYQWVFANWFSGRFAILPADNLISNIGFGSDATHTISASKLANMATVPMQFPLEHPLAVMRNSRADHHSRRTAMRRPLWRRGISFLISKLRQFKR